MAASPRFRLRLLRLRLPTSLEKAQSLPILPTPTQPPTSSPNFVGGILPARPGSPSGPASVCDYSGANTPVINGNVEQPMGELLHHAPGGLFYSTTVVKPAQRDRWFYTESEAQALGWKRSKRWVGVAGHVSRILILNLFCCSRCADIECAGVENPAWMRHD